MSFTRRQLFKLAYALVLPVLLSSYCKEVRAQQALIRYSIDPTVYLSKKETCNFEDALSKLALEEHITLVVEGEPLHPLLPDKEALEFPQTGVPFGKALAKIADAYDYDIQHSRNVYQLKKRYTDPKDMPCVTLQECIQALDDVKTITDALNPNVPRFNADGTDPCVSDLIQTLTPEQMVLLHERRLPVSDLTPEQQSLAYRTALSIFVQMPAEDVSTAMQSIKDASQATFCDQSQCFGYTTPPGTSAALTLSEYIKVQKTPNKPVIHRLRQVSPESRKPADPKTESKPVAPISTNFTLEEAVADLNTHLSVGHIRVDSALKDKPIAIFGRSNADPEALLAAFVNIYGLRVAIEEKNVRRITRPLFRIPLDAAGLPEAVRSVFPEPFLRALHDDTDKVPSYQQRELRQPNQGVTALPPVLLHDAALQELVDSVEPRVRSALYGSMPVSAVSELDRQAFATVLMAQCLMSLHPLLTGRTPYYISNFDQVVLYGGIEMTEDKKSAVSLNFGLPSRYDGKILDGVGITDFIPIK